MTEITVTSYANGTFTFSDNSTLAVFPDFVGNTNWSAGVLYERVTSHVEPTVEQDHAILAYNDEVWESQGRAQRDAEAAEDVIVENIVAVFRDDPMIPRLTAIQMAQLALEKAELALYYWGRPSVHQVAKFF